MAIDGVRIQEAPKTSDVREAMAHFHWTNLYVATTFTPAEVKFQDADVPQDFPHLFDDSEFQKGRVWMALSTAAQNTDAFYGNEEEQILGCSKHWDRSLKNLQASQLQNVWLDEKRYPNVKLNHAEETRVVGSIAVFESRKLYDVAEPIDKARPPPDDELHFEISTLSVAPALRGKGLGRKLYNVAMEYIMEHQKHSSSVDKSKKRIAVNLWTAEGRDDGQPMMTQACAMYKKDGFEIKHIEKCEWGDTKVDWIYMRKYIDFSEEDLK
eukprot:TRINITY_DN11681_c0_g4_i1.p1 TRINITY_DN11681_c0_g4~~TRINITY_DN11681_c0_g4_i1.p1  ORF type:complete len:268 (-),score=38.53 TRINITY_DN11681_c0_g4_i1:536-1339(-)